MLNVTPFHPRTSALCLSQAWRRWAGHVVASSYELNHEREYHAIRNSAALLDVSPLYKYLISGRDAARLLDRIVTRDIGRLEPHQVVYTTWCDSAGKVMDDGTGFPEALNPDKGMGLRIMNYRAGMIGGSLDIRRANEKGTTVTCSFKNDS